MEHGHSGRGNLEPHLRVREDDDRLDPDPREPLLTEEAAEHDRMSDGLLHGVIKLRFVVVEHLGPRRLIRVAVDRAPIVLRLEGVHAFRRNDNVIDLSAADDQVVNDEPAVREAVQHLSDPAFADGAEVELVAAAQQHRSGEDADAAEEREAGNHEDNEHAEGKAEHATSRSGREGGREALLAFQDGCHGFRLALRR